MIISSGVVKLLHYVQSLFDKPVYLVGGAVRDLELEDFPKDFDFCSSLTPEEIKEQLKGKHRAYLTGERHGTIGFKVDTQMIEITTFRTETYKGNLRQPNVEFVSRLEEDLGRRDLTINAMAMTCNTFRLIDPFNGLEDIKNGIIRAVGNAKLRFKEDPLRILRAVRFAARYGFDFDELTYRRLNTMAPLLLTLSKERIMDELDKILMLYGIKTSHGLDILWMRKMFTYIIPELQLQCYFDQDTPYHKYTLHAHTRRVVAAVPQDINMRWAALLHDIAKPFTRTKNKKGYSNYINHEILGADMAYRIAVHMKWSKERRETVVELVRNHLEDDSELKIYDDENKL